MSMPQLTIDKPQLQDDLFATWEPPVEQKPRGRRKTRWIAAAIALLLAAGAFTTWRVLAKPAAAAFTPVEVKRGYIAQTISATGKVQAVTTVQVGTQVSGTVAELFADFNQNVKAGQLIARLDPSQLEVQLQQARASHASAQANVTTAQMGVTSADANVQAAEANVARTNAVLEDAQRNYQLVREQVDAQVRARRDLDPAQAAVAQATAQVQQAQAQAAQSRAQAQAARSQWNQAQAQAMQAKGAVDLATVNLGRTNIYAPIDGVVVSRNVDVGQTVAASLQAPTLFLIAKDLTRMQVLADIDEADVGRLTTESKVKFTVDAYPQDTFEGRISQIRLAPQTVQNVVTYTAVIDVANPDLKLKPGMTANVTATVAERDNVLIIPNSALRFRPAEPKEPQAAQPKRPRNGGAPVWKVEADKLTRVPVRLGLSDGVNTEVVSGDLRESDRIAAPSVTADSARPGAAQSSPFAPSRGGRGGRR